jgi:ABC-type multidrug transport system fused ATPase/permease subunit
MQAYQFLPYTEYIRRNSSEYIYSIQQLTAQYSGQVVLPLLRTISDGMVAFLILILLALQNIFALALLVVLLGLIFFLNDIFFRNNLKKYGENINKASATIIQGVSEGMDGLKEIRVLGKEQYFYQMVHKNAKKQAFFGTKALTLAMAPKYILELTMISFIMLLVLATLLLGNNIDTLLPTLGVFGIASLRLFPAANALVHSLTQIRYSRDSVTRLYNDQHRLKQLSDKEGYSMSAQIPKQFQVLNLDRVSFTYPQSEYKALNEISLEIKAGESIGLIGPSGSGKTTLVDMLLGLLEPQQGSIQYNGEEVKTALGQWRSQSAYIPQQVFLIDDTLRHNVALGIASDEIDNEKLQESLRQSKLIEVVEQLPQGINTVLGEKGVRLSGGQRQRVALARAFYHGRDVLVMDEATSALDDQTEREIVKEIDQLKGKKTIIVIAHRLTTLKHCDRIYKLENGRVTAVGSYKELIEDAK